MIDLQILEEHGLTQENLRKWFDEDPETRKTLSKEQQDKIDELRHHIRNRVQWGRDWNLAHYQHYHALDLAWDTPFRQISPTLLQSIMGQNVGDEKSDVTQKLKSWGFDLEKVIERVPDPKVPGKFTTRVCAPAFFQIFVPLVRAYTTIRWAKIINDRRLVPFFKFEPAISTPENRLKSEAITSRIELMSRQMGYFEVMKQAVFQMLHYGVCLQFPVEEWWTEEQLNRPKKKEKKKESPKTDEATEAEQETEETEEDDGKYKTTIVREGIRYHMPHPTRMFWDQAHRISTFNTDTGCEFAGYWRILRFADVFNNPSFWNTNMVPMGTSNWWDKAYTYFQTVYRCTLNFPPVPANATDGAGPRDREANLENRFYSGVNSLDQSVMLTEYFEKIIPKDRGMGTYPHPVWFRFVVCGDAGTVIYAAPLPYPPVVAYAYDSDELRDTNASLSLECLPFQDQFSNLLSQYLLTVQHNLTNLTFVDKEQVDEKVIDQLENAGAMQWVKRVIIRFAGSKWRSAQRQIPQAGYSVNFQQLDANGILQAMRIVLDTLERVLVMSSQEVAQAASHEQTREEVRNIQASTSTRLVFTETPVDLARDAWKKQIYHGLMSYGAKSFYAVVPFETPIDKKMLDKLGFTYNDDGMDDNERYRNRKVNARVKDKTAIALESFASSRDGDDRINNVESAIAIATFVRDIVNSPYGAVLGPDQFIEIANQIARLAGFPRDFKLVNKMPPGASPEQQQEEAKKQLMQIVEVVTQNVQKQIAPALDELAQGVKASLEIDAGQSEAIKALANTLANLQAALGISPMPPAPNSSPYAGSDQATQPGTPPPAPVMAGPVGV